ncbi:uncharacterized protein LOC126720529 isoform X2 [Quercus robur]|uniref:uncharacterized protein LOC126720529 isoform X2 n=1 Tax=Quercus robur TaxID=38942 RepID=UPI00216214A0|nr:uncharacterized protein LOC126720529 isoform X2 [Quercus robur]
MGWVGCMSIGNTTDPARRDRPKVETERGGVISLLPDNLSEIGVEYVEEPDEVILPVQIENLKGKQFVFQIQLNDYNLNYGWEFYTIKKLFDSFEETDKAIQLDKMTEVYISDSSNECSNNLSIEEDGDCTKFQKLDVQTNVQLTPTSVLQENKRAYSGTTTKQQRKKIQKTL